MLRELTLSSEVPHFPFSTPQKLRKLGSVSASVNIFTTFLYLSGSHLQVKLSYHSE